MRLTKYQYKRLQADIGGLTTLYAIIKAEKHKEKEPKPRVRFRFLFGGERGICKDEPYGEDGIAEPQAKRHHFGARSRSGAKGEAKSETK